jgi:hypothetical protein
MLSGRTLDIVADFLVDVVIRGGSIGEGPQSTACLPPK